GKALITAAGARKPVLSGEEAEYGLNAACREVLDKAFLIRSESRGGATWYELAHDRLVEPVRQDNERWRAAALTPLHMQAHVCAAARDRPDDLLVTGEV